MIRYKVTLKFKDGDIIECALDEHVVKEWLEDEKISRNLGKFCDIVSVEEVNISEE